MSAFAEAKFAWEPVTPRGVAAFARASLERLLVVQASLALIVTAIVVWSLVNGILPTLDRAVQNLPPHGEIERGQLLLTASEIETPRILAEGHFLALTLDVENSRALRSPAHFQFIFTRDSLVIVSLLGELTLPYPPAQAFHFNRPEVQPLWGAWAPNLIGLAAIGTFLGLLLTWWSLATLYFLPVWLVGFFTDRKLNFRAAWKMAGAAVLPGGLLMALGLALYALAVFDLVQLGFTFTLHFVVGWIYLFVSPMFLDRALPAPARNPFQPG